MHKFSLSPFLCLSFSLTLTHTHARKHVHTQTHIFPVGSAACGRCESHHALNYNGVIEILHGHEIQKEIPCSSRDTNPVFMNLSVQHIRLCTCFHFIFENHQEHQPGACSTVSTKVNVTNSTTVLCALAASKCILMKVLFVYIMHFWKKQTHNLLASKQKVVGLIPGL